MSAIKTSEFPVIRISAYSFRTNLSYMLMTFFQPRRLIERILNETSLYYGIVPVVISEILYTALGWSVYLTQPQLGWSLNPIAQAFSLSRRQMALIQVIAHPFIGLVDVFLYAGTVYLVARSLQAKRIPLRSWLLFFMFLWGTFSCIAFLYDTMMLYPTFGWDEDFLVYLHHLVAIASIVYMVSFLHRKSALEIWRSSLITLSGYAVVLASRVVFVP